MVSCRVTRRRRVAENHRSVILFLHHRYRTLGGEERAVDDLAWVVREHLGEDVEVLTRDSTTISPARAAEGLLRGGLQPQDVTRAVRMTGARVVHAHNLHPTFGWRALRAARQAGARTVLHLHNYRLVCAVATCVDPGGNDCTRCHGRNTRPGLELNCRRNRAEGFAYAAGLALQQHRLVAEADAIVVPSEAALHRLHDLGAPIRDHHDVRVIGHAVRRFATEPSAAADGAYALVASRLAHEKGIDLAIDACRAADIRLTIAGDGPERAALERQAGPTVTFTGRVDDETLDALRRNAALEIVPTRAAETFGLSAVEAMAQGVPVVASALGALTDLAPEAVLVTPNHVSSLAHAITTTRNDAERGDRGRARAAELAAPSAIAQRLQSLYG